MSFGVRQTTLVKVIGGALGVCVVLERLAFTAAAHVTWVDDECASQRAVSAAYRSKNRASVSKIAPHHLKHAEDKLSSTEIMSKTSGSHK
eukprot:5867475-Pleurochrysis_carterae.AAC.1